MQRAKRDAIAHASYCVEIDRAGSASGLRRCRLNVAVDGRSADVPLPKPRPSTVAAVRGQAGRPCPVRPNRLAEGRSGGERERAGAPVPGADMRRPAPLRPGGGADGDVGRPATSQADAEAVEAGHRGAAREEGSGAATQIADTISDPVARKLAEWVILRSDGNGASMERYRASSPPIRAGRAWTPSPAGRSGVVGRPPRRLDRARLVRQRRAGFRQGTAGAGARPARRGDRRSAERLVRDAWRGDAMSGDTETAALEEFGALLSAADHKARMDYALYANDAEIALRAAHRLGAGYVALAKACLAAIARRTTRRRCSMPYRTNCATIRATCSAASGSCGAKRRTRRPRS